LASSAKWTYGFAELSANPKRGTVLSYFANEEQDRKSLSRTVTLRELCANAQLDLCQTVTKF